MKIKNIDPTQLILSIITIAVFSGFANLAIAELDGKTPHQTIESSEEENHEEHGEEENHAEHGEEENHAEHGEEENHAEHGEEENHAEHGEEENHAEHGEEENHAEHGEKGHAKKKEHGHKGEENSITLSKSQIKEFGIKTQRVKSGELEIYAELPGEVVVNSDRTVHFFPRYRGVVKKINKFVGDPVKKGDILAVIESNESFQNYNIRSQVSGTVIEKHLSLGEVVQDDSKIFVITDLSIVWINLSAYQQDVLTLKKNQKVFISAATDIPQIISKIEYISPIFDEKTRTARVRVHIPNPNNLWRPGSFVSSKIIIEKQKVGLMIARSAIQKVQNKPSVFIYDGKKFNAKAVKLGKTDEKYVEVIAGLKLDDNYVSEGAFTLKADLEKSQFGDGHNH